MAFCNNRASRVPHLLLRLSTAAVGGLLCLLAAPMDTTAQDVTVPGAPTVGALTAGERWLGVTWTAPTNNGGSAVTAYDLRYRKTAGSTWIVVGDVWETGGGGLLHVVSGEDGDGLDTTTGYDVQVRAVNSAGDGAWSTTQASTTAETGNARTSATTLPLATASGGAIAPVGDNRFPGSIGSATDVDYYRIVLTSAHAPQAVDFWIYTQGEVNTVGKLLDSAGREIKSNDDGDQPPHPGNFFIWDDLSAGTYYVEVAGSGSSTGDYLLLVPSFLETTARSNAVDLPAGGSTGGTAVANDADYFKIVLDEQTDLILRGSGFPLPENLKAELQDSNGAMIVANDDGDLGPNAFDFLIRRDLTAGTYYLKVELADNSSTGGPYTVSAVPANDPGASTSSAQTLPLFGTAGGNISPAGDADYFSITFNEPVYTVGGNIQARIWAVKNGNATVAGDLLNSDGVDIAEDYRNVQARFGTFEIRHSFVSGTTYYLKVTADDGASTGKYTVLVTVDNEYTRLLQDCSAIMRSSGIDDALYGCQWHLKNNNQFSGGAGEDINVENVWAGGNLGEGITVAVVDTGFQPQHQNLRDNVDATKNHDYRGNNDLYNPLDNHGTSVAGVIAARDNSFGVRGVAPRATLYGYNLLSIESVETYLARQGDAMSRNADTTAVSNNSWGTPEKGMPQTVSAFWERAVENGTKTGYGGKGVFYVWAAGNGAERNDYSTFDEHSNFYAVTAVCAVNHLDKRAPYSELGSNLWVCAPSDNGYGDHGMPAVATTINHNRFRVDFGGTSSAAPVVSGVGALVRKANPALTWRDLKLILAGSARKVDPSNKGWDTGSAKYEGGGSYQFNHEYGFGVVDAKAAVDLANGWTNVPRMRTATAASGSLSVKIGDATSSTAPGTLLSKTLVLDADVEFIEYVQVDAHFRHREFRHLEVELVSPSGKVSTLAPFTSSRPGAVVNMPFRFGSAKHLGESAEGTWTLRIQDHVPVHFGFLESWEITAYGHGIKPLEPEIEELFSDSAGFTVAWAAPDDSGRSNITAYDVRYIKTSEDEADDDNWTVVDNAWASGSLRYSASGLDAGAQYDVQVRAVNSDGDGVWSTTSTVTPTTAEAPTIQTITPGNGTLAVAWSAPASTTLGTISAYDLRYGAGSSPSSWVTVQRAWTSENLKYAIAPSPPLTNGATYAVQVRAVVGTTAKAWSANRIGVPRTAPGAPSISAVDQGDSGELVIKWAAPSSNGGADIASYNLRYIKTSADETTDANWTIRTGVWSSGSGDREHTQAGLENWHRYDLQIQAVNEAGAGAWSVTRTGAPTQGDVDVTLGWSATTLEVDESSGTAALSAVATTAGATAPPSDFFFDLTAQTADGTAVQPGDYIGLDAEHTFRAADFTAVTVDGNDRHRATRDFTVSVINDTNHEPEETFTVTLSYANPDVPQLQGGDAVATVTITDDDVLPLTVSFSSPTYTAAEGGSVTVTVELSANPERNVTIPLTSTNQGGATSADYSGVPASVTFNSRETSKTFTFSATQDTVDDDGESVKLTFGALPTEVSAGTTNETTVTIMNRDTPPLRVSFCECSYTVAERNTIDVIVSLNALPGRRVVVPIVRNNQDGADDAGYSGVPSSVTFEPWEAFQTITFMAEVDSVDDDGESVKLTFGNLPAGVSAGTCRETTVSITEEDAPPVEASFEKSAYTVEEDSFVGVIVTLSAAPKRRVVVPITFANEDGATGADYTIDHYPRLRKWVVFEPSDSSRSFRFKAVKDAIDEGEERVRLGFGALPGGLSEGTTGEATVTIKEDPPTDPEYGIAPRGQKGTKLATWENAWQNDGLPVPSNVIPGVSNSLYSASCTGPQNFIIKWGDEPEGKGHPEEWEARIDPSRGVREIEYAFVVHETTGLPELRGTAILDGQASFSISVRGRWAGNEWGTWSKPVGLFCHVICEKVKEDTGMNAPENSPAEGRPRIGGTATVGQTLSADTTGIIDSDGLDSVTFDYQWLADDTEIAGATAAAYTVASGDAGKAIAVRVSFTDDAGNAESLTSKPTGAVEATDLWVDRAILDGADLTLTYNEILDDGVTLPATAFSISVNGQARSVTDVSVAGSALSLTLASAASAGDSVTVSYTRPEGPDFIRDIQGRIADSFSGLLVANNTAGAPLTASVHGVQASHDGSAAFTFELHFTEELPVSYKTLRDHAFTVTGGEVTNAKRKDPPSNVQWVITVQPSGAGDLTVTLPATTDCEAQGAICTEDGRMLSNPVEETVAGPDSRRKTLNTPATGSPTIRGTARAGETLAASTSGIADADGLTKPTFTYQWLRDDTDIGEATKNTYTPVDADVGRTVRVRVTFTDDAGNAESLASTATATVAARPNAPATGAPSITGAAQVGETLTAAPSGIGDADGLTKVSYTYQWVRNDGNSDADIRGATGSIYTLVDADVGKTIRVRVSFTDDRGNQETLTSAATGAVAAAPSPLTVSAYNEPASHDGSDVFTFELEFSEEFPVRYTNLRDHAFTVTGGEVINANRDDPPSNVDWVITVQPSGDGDVTVVLPATTDCEVQGAICTADGRMLSTPLTLTVSGPGG